MFRNLVRRASRVANFNAGPAGLPLPVLEQAQRDLVNWKGSGMSVMEMSHRSKEYESIHQNASKNLRSLLQIPENYHVLFVQGGASTQFAAVPLNLIGLGGKNKADYLVSGDWSKKAAAEAKKYGQVNVVATGAGKKFSSIPDPSTWQLSKDAAYLHYCDNETVHGLEMPSVPQVSVPIVADMSSNFISKPVDVSKFGVIYAGAQKNVGPSGVTIVIARKDLIGHALGVTPVMLDYKTMVESDSLYNTPPTFIIYVAGLVFEWLQSIGGLPAIAKRNAEKSSLLYETIDKSNGFYHSPVNPAHRSRMNVPFRVGSGTQEKDFTDTEAAFVKGAKALGMEGLKGHRAVGGIRASLYNAVTVDDVAKLTKYMKEFQARHEKK